VAGPLFGLIFSIIGLNQIKKAPERYKGEGFAIAGIAISALYFFFLFIVLGSRR
jgi:hypothetical protein